MKKYVLLFSSTPHSGQALYLAFGNFEKNPHSQEANCGVRAWVFMDTFYKSKNRAKMVLFSANHYESSPNRRLGSACYFLVREEDVASREIRQSRPSYSTEPSHVTN